MLLTLDGLQALVILKVFSPEFLPIGTVFTVYGVLVLLIAWRRRAQATKLILQTHPHRPQRHQRNSSDNDGVVDEGESREEDEQMNYFETSGGTVVLLTIVTVLSYIALLALIYLL